MWDIFKLQPLNTNISPQMGLKDIVAICVILLLALIADKSIKRFIQPPKNLDTPRTRTYLSIIKSLLSIVTFLSAIYFVFVILGINVTPLFASASIIGIILGLGLRPLLEDFFTGLFIFTQDIISIGDFACIGEVEGTVDMVGFRTITIRDETGAMHTFPNREVKKIVNFSRRKTHLLIDIPIKKDDKVIDDILTMFKTILDQLRTNKNLGKFIQNGSTVLGIQEIKDDGGLIIRTVIITKASKREEIERLYRYLVLKEFEKQEIIWAK